MTKLTIAVNDWSKLGVTAPVNSLLVLQLAKPVMVDGRLVTTEPWTVQLDSAGNASTELPAAETGNGVVVRPRFAGLPTIAIAGYGGVEEISLVDAVNTYQVDRDSLEPMPVAPAAWWASLAALQEVAVSDEELADAINGLYTKPASGIPLLDLAASVRESLEKADSALQAVPPSYATELEDAVAAISSMAGDVRPWAPNTAYTAGQAVVSPSGDVVTAKTAHTSAATFSGTGPTGNWNLSTARNSLLPVNGVNGLRTITIMTYHSVPALANFQTDCDYYQEWNYTTITCDDIANYLAGTGTLPTKPLLITFDDGLPTQYACAQELNTRGMKGTWFIASGWIDGLYPASGPGFAENTPLTWTQLNQMKAWGMDIQSHTVNHQDQTTLTAAQVASEYANSKARIETMVTGQTVHHLAFPYGACNDTTLAAERGAGVQIARLVRMDPATGNYPGPNLGRYAFANTAMNPLKLPTAGTSFGDIIQPNAHRTIHPDEDLIADYGFEGGGKGWSLGSGFAVATDRVNSGKKSLKCTQGTSTVSSSVTRPVPVGPYSRIFITGWINSTLPAGNYAKVQLQILKADGSTIVRTTDVGVVTGPAGWTQFSFTYTGDLGDYYAKVYCVVQGNATPSGAAWFDDISVKRDPIGSPFSKPV